MAVNRQLAQAAETKQWADNFLSILRADLYRLADDGMTIAVPMSGGQVPRLSDFWYREPAGHVSLLITAGP
jgi:hypothetical protein